MARPPECRSSGPAAPATAAPACPLPPLAGKQVVSVRLAGGRVVDAPDELMLSQGDTLVLSGLPEPLSLAEAKLLKG